MSGFPVWNATTFYQIGSTVIGSDGNLYKAVTTNGGQNPISNPTYWTQETSTTVVPISTIEANDLPLSFLDARYQPSGAYVAVINAGQTMIKDGVTNNATAMTTLNSSLASAASGVVYWPKGTYVSTVPFQPTSGIVTYGDGYQSELLQAPASLDPTASSQPIWVNSVTDVTIKDLQVNGNFTSVAKSGGFVMPSNQDSVASISGTLAATAGATVTLTGSLGGIPYGIPLLLGLDNELFIGTVFGMNLTAIVRGVQNTTAASHTNVALRQSGGTTGAGFNGWASTMFDANIIKYGQTSMKVYCRAGSIDAGNYLTSALPLRISNSQRVNCTRVRATNSIGPGILTDASSVGGCSKIQIRDCSVDLTWDNGIYFHVGTAFASANDNVVTDTMYCGVAGIYADHIEADGNLIRYAGPSFSDSGGVIYGGCSNSNVTANTIDSVAFEGVEFENSFETGITGGNAGHPVRSTNCWTGDNLITNAHCPTYSVGASYICAGLSIIGADNSGFVGDKVYGADFGAELSTGCFNPKAIDLTVMYCYGPGIQTGNSDTVLNAIIKGGTVEGCGITQGDDQLLVYAPAQVQNVTVRWGPRDGISVRQWTGGPNGNTSKTDYIIDNTITDCARYGVELQGGADAFTYVEGNRFGNTQGGVQYCTDGQVTSSGNTLTSSQATWTIGDIVTVVGVGSGDGDCVASVSSITGNVATLTFIAGATQWGRSATGVSFGVQSGGQVFADCALVANQLSSTAAAFTSADVGATWTLFYSGSINSLILATGTISSVSAGVATLSSSPGTTTPIMVIITRSSSRQQYGVRKSSGAARVVGNKSKGLKNSLYYIYDYGVQDVVFGNDSFGDGTPTRDSYAGTGQINSGSSSVNISHGLGLTPQLLDITVTPTSALQTATTWAITAVSATTFTVTTYNSSGVATNVGANWTFGWKAAIGARI